MNIDFIGQTTWLPEGCLNLLRELLSTAVKREIKVKKIEFTVCFVNDNDIQQLNQSYRNLNEPTDVLSFPLFKRHELVNVDQTIPILLGDIVISVERAKEQAIEYDHSLTREISFLAIHGLLHLLGYDHETDEEERAMFQKQKDILKEFHVERS